MIYRFKTVEMATLQGIPEDVATKDLTFVKKWNNHGFPVIEFRVEGYDKTFMTIESYLTKKIVP